MPRFKLSGTIDFAFECDAEHEDAAIELFHGILDEVQRQYSFPDAEFVQLEAPVIGVTRLSIPAAMFKVEGGNNTVMGDHFVPAEDAPVG